MDSPQINELVNLLDHLNLPALKTLRKKYPHNLDDLAVSGVLGDTPARLQLDVALATLKEFRPAVDRLLPRVRRRLRQSQIWDAVAQLTAAVGGATILVKPYPVAGGVMALLGGLTGLAVKFLRQDFAGVEGGLQKVYADIAEVSWNARETELLLQGFAGLEADPDPGEIAPLITRANEQSRQLHAFIRDYGP